MSTRRAGLPTVEESQAYLADQNPNKRDQLVDALVDSERLRLVLDADDRRYLRSNAKKLNPTGGSKFRLCCTRASALTSLSTSSPASS